MTLATKISGQDVIINIDVPSGSADSAANIGTAGVGIFKQKNGTEFEFKKLEAASGKLTVVANGDNEHVDIDLGTVAIADISSLQAALDAKSDTGHLHVAANVTDFDIQVRTSRLDQMTAPSADVSLNSHKLTNLTDPSGAQDAATKAYVDSAAQGLDVKASVIVASIANGALAAAFENGDTVDGVVLVTGDRILLKDQTTASENGIYTVNASGAPTRSTDADEDSEVTSGLFTFASSGTVNGGNGWVLTTPDPIVVDTTDLTFSQFSGGGAIVAGTGITQTGNVLSTNDAQIVHQSLSGHGTNTHAQIDTHIADTANPHATTKTQVGLGNVDNTSDVNKPVSTAQQTALNLKSNTGHTHTTTEITALAEYIQDTVAALLVAGTNVALVYDDALGTLTVSTTGGSGSGASYEALVAPTNTIQAWKDAATATYTGDGSGDEVQLNARLAASDNRTVKPGPGTLTTAAAVAFTDGVKHNLRGDQTDASIIAAAHNGNIIEIHSAGLPQEYRTGVYDLALNKSGTSTPNRGISIINGSQIELERIRVRNCVDGIYGYFLNTSHSSDLEISQCTNGIHITGGNGLASHLNKLTRYNSRDNRVGLRFTDRAQQWLIEQPSFYGYAIGDVGIMYDAGALEIDSHDYIQPWFENAAGFSGQWYAMDVRAPLTIRLERPRIGMASGDFIRPDTIHPDAIIEIWYPIVSNWSALNNLPPNVRWYDEPTAYNNNGRDSFGVVNRHPGVQGESNRFPVLSGRSASFGSISARGFGAGAQEKNLVTSVNLADTAAWTSDAGAVPTSGVTDPNGGTAAYTLATSAVKKHTMVSANGGAALAGAVFTGVVSVKGANGSRLSILANDVVNAGTLEKQQYIALKDDQWEDVPFVIRCPSGWTGTSLRVRFFAFGGPVSIWNPTIVKSERVPPYLGPSRDLSSWPRPYTTEGAGLTVVTTGTAIPTTGTWAVGDIIKNTSPTAAIERWYCVTAGTPGVWAPQFRRMIPEVNIDSFGALPGTGNGATNLAALTAAKAVLTALGGGALVGGTGVNTYCWPLSGPAVSPTFYYGISFDWNDAGITFVIPDGVTHTWDTGLTTANLTNAQLIIVQGLSGGARRTAPTKIVGGGTLDGAFTTYSGTFPGFPGTRANDHALITTIYADGVEIDGLRMRNGILGNLHIMRTSSRVKIRNVLIDQTHALGENSGFGCRFEADGVDIGYSKLVTHATSGQSAIAFGCNADIASEGRFMKAHHLLLLGGLAGALIDFGGVTGCEFTDSVIMDQCDNSGLCITFSHYTNANGSLYHSRGNIVRGLVAVNCRSICQMGDRAGLLGSTNYASGAWGNTVEDVVWLRDLEGIRTNFLTSVAYPVAFYGASDTAAIVRAPGYVTVNMSVGFQQAYAAPTNGSGTATGGGTNTLLDSTKSGIWTLDQFKNFYLYFQQGGRWYKAKILSNTTTGALTLASALPSAILTGTPYWIGGLGGGNRCRNWTIWTNIGTFKAVEVLNHEPWTEIENIRVYGVTSAVGSLLVFNFGDAKHRGCVALTGDPEAVGANNMYQMFADSDEGQGTILSGTTTVVINHWLGHAPLPRKIRLSYDGGNVFGSKHLFVTGITNTQFTINTDVPVTANTLVGWVYEQGW